MKQLKLRGFQVLKEYIGIRYVADPDLPKDLHKFNEAIGLPTHPAQTSPTG